MAKSLNMVTLLGNLTNNPELTQAPSGQTMARFSVALNRSYKDSAGEWVDAVDFIDCVAWGRLAEKLSGVTKGAKVLVNGRLQNRSWTTDGVKRSKTEVLANDVITLDLRIDRSE